MIKLHRSLHGWLCCNILGCEKFVRFRKVEKARNNQKNRLTEVFTKV